ncbi:heterokaryon incompatibility protein-domain-containing protein, partial [Ilyonectria robusta]|uniref:heterokaryon incompatibility protein-domain-containing protein n=1 Tax=Ilyonectria robusta TaxID=1079257 RepID=UPI001E8DC618
MDVRKDEVSQPAALQSDSGCIRCAFGFIRPQAVAPVPKVLDGMATSPTEGWDEDLCANCRLCGIIAGGLPQLRELFPSDFQGNFDRVSLAYDETGRTSAFVLGSSGVNSNGGAISLPLEVFTLAHNPRSGNLLPPCLQWSRDVPATLQLTQAAETVKRWIVSCDKHHPQCAIRSSSVLPTRVLDLGVPGNKSGIKLKVTSGLSAPYIALSYCWGSSQTTFSTTTLSLRDRLNGIPWDPLPKTFQDVIEFCWAMKISYLWIDALCIVQDDPADWELRAADMANVYSNSLLTVAATRCPNNATSLFSDRWTSFPLPGGGSLPAKTTTISLQFGNETIYVRPQLHVAHSRFIEMDNAKHHITDAPLMTRAWAYQERLLPPRCLHFHAEELVWECNTGLKCECMRLDDPESQLTDTEKHGATGLEAYEPSKYWLKSCLTRALNDNAAVQDLRFAWFDIVSEFSRLELTYEKDRLPAVYGLAKKLSRPILGRYLAGMWEGDLAAGLLWQTAASRRLDAPHSPHTREVPSWSWASILGPNSVFYDRGLSSTFWGSPFFRLIAVEGRDTFGSICDAKLKIEGLLCDCTQPVQSLIPRKTELAGEDLFASQESQEMSRRSVFLDDGRIVVSDALELYFLHLGRRAVTSLKDQSEEEDESDGSGRSGSWLRDNGYAHYGLVLRKSSLDDDTYQRVGILICPDYKWNWGVDAKSPRSGWEEVSRLLWRDCQALKNEALKNEVYPDIKDRYLCQILLV